jgi:outer membrane protein TolC
MRRIQTDERGLARLDRLLELTRSREQQGVSGRIDTLRVEQQHGEVASRLENSREQYRAEVEDFADLIGADKVVDWEWEEPPILEIELPAMDEAVDIALSNRLDYAQVLEGYRTSDRQVQIAYRRLLPDLNVTTRYTRTGDEESDAFAFDEEDWFAGLSIASDLNMQASRSAYRRSRVARSDALVLIQDREFAIARDVRQQIRAYRRARADFRITTRNEDVARRRLELADSLFRLGKSDNFSVTDAENDLRSAQDAVLSARAEASLAAYRLLRALDTLIECPAELKPQLLAESDERQPPVLSSREGAAPAP